MNTLNVALLRQTLAYIETHPDEWNQTTWRNTDADYGTACCFAGWAVTLAGGQFENIQYVKLDSLPIPADTAETLRDFAIDLESTAHISDAAAWLLGLFGAAMGEDDGYYLDSGAASYLFDPENELEDLRRIVAELIAEAGA